MRSAEKTTGDTPRSVPRVPFWLALGLLAYLGFQVIAPLWLKVQPVAETSGDFSWDMFSHRASCSELSAVATLPNGSVKPLKLERAFQSAELRRLLYRPRLEQFAKFVCDGLSERYGARVALSLKVQCRHERDGALVALTDPARNYCSGS